MNTALFIRRPVLTTLFMAAIMLFGLMAYRLLPVSDLPNVDFPTIQVTASLPGATPETMASAVATPLERQFTTIAGIDSMTSTSALGIASITITFTLERNIDAAAQDVQAAITKAAPLLPPGMPTPPIYQKVNPADQPVIYLALSSATLPLYTVDEYAQTNLAQRISTINGVAQVFVFGSQKYAVRVQVDPRALATRGIGIDEVEQAIARGNVNKPTGTLYGANQAFNVQATGQLKDAAAYRPLVVAYRNGAPVRLEQIGRVIDGVQTDKVASWFNKERAVVLAVQRQPGTNTVEVVDAIRALLPTFRQQLPAALNLNVVYDRSVAIRESVHDVEFTLLLTVALVVLVIFLFLRNVSATIIPSLAVPLSIVGTFAVMYLLGYTIDIISLMALTLCVGLRRGRRRGHAREHRAPHGGGREPDGGRPQGRRRDRLHHPVDDGVAGRGVHPGAVHGRSGRAAAPRVRRHHRRRRPRLRPGVADPHPHAVQPLSAAAPPGAQPPLPGLRALLRRHAGDLRSLAAVGAPAPAHDDGRPAA